MVMGNGKAPGRLMLATTKPRREWVEFPQSFLYATQAHYTW